MRTPPHREKSSSRLKRTAGAPLIKGESSPFWRQKVFRGREGVPDDGGGKKVLERILETTRLTFTTFAGKKERGAGVSMGRGGGGALDRGGFTRRRGNLNSEGGRCIELFIPVTGRNSKRQVRNQEKEKGAA